MSSEPTAADVAIEVRGLCKSYRVVASPARELARLLFGLRRRGPEFQALRDIDFTVRRGETMGIVGRNGAGKSTLLQVICGTLTPSRGTVRVNGRLAALLELGAGFNPEFTGRENVYLSAAIYGLGRAEIEARMAQILAFAEIGDFIDQPVKTYSSGMFVRLAFAVIAHVDADILIIDEALAVGDVYFTQKCMRFLREFARRGTLLFVSHDTQAVMNLCERAVWLDGGRVRLLGSAREVAQAYVGSFYEERQCVDGAAAKSGPGGDAEPASAIFGDEFGTGRARILSAVLQGEDGAELHLHDRAQWVTLTVVCRAHEPVDDPIIGFYIKDRLGQPVCGYNSIGRLGEWRRLEAEHVCRVRFRFPLPRLATGDYAVTIALAAGTQEHHEQHHWIHDAMTFKARADISQSGVFELASRECELLDDARSEP